MLTAIIMTLIHYSVECSQRSSCRAGAQPPYGNSHLLLLIEAPTEAMINHVKLPLSQTSTGTAVCLCSSAQMPIPWLFSTSSLCISRLLKKTDGYANRAADS
jgi:hypothetical protein